MFDEFLIVELRKDLSSTTRQNICSGIYLLNTVFYASWTAQPTFSSGVAQLKLKLARDEKSSMKGFCTCISNEKESLLLTTARDLAMKQIKKAKAHSTFFLFLHRGAQNCNQAITYQSKSSSEDHESD